MDFAPTWTSARPRTCTWAAPVLADRFVICKPVGLEGDLSGMVVVENWASEFTRTP
jgi:hypothetical protein